MEQDGGDGDAASQNFNGCLTVKVKRISLRNSFIERVQLLYPSLDISGLRLLLVFRGQIYELETQKKDFM